MDRAHWILIFYWILYVTLHSLGASAYCKGVIEKLMGAGYAYYRLAYSFFALLSLILVLYYQISMPSEQIFNFLHVKYLIGLPVGLTGVFIMWVCSSKYIVSVSGFFIKRLSNIPQKLETTGIHRLVRHPLYLGTLMLIWSLFLFYPFLKNLISCGLITAYVIVGIRLEEKKLIIQFGKAYMDYCNKVPGLIIFTKGW